MLLRYGSCVISGDRDFATHCGCSKLESEHYVTVQMLGLFIGILDSVSFYEEYKPFRNYIRRFDLLSSLADVWRYSLHVMEDHPLPADYAIGRNPLLSGPLKEHLYPWDLDILAKELVLNAGSGGDRSLKRWSDLVVAINHLRRLDDAAYAQSGGERVDVMFELHRIAHRQFPWQMKFGVNPMMRAFKVFGEAAVSACSNAFFNPPLRLSNKPMVSFFHYKS
jgi:hypothetical protein